MKQPGTLIGVGVGPGDARLMTPEARATIAGATTLAYIHARGRESQARRIAHGAIGPGAREIAIAVDMAADEASRRAAYDHALPAIRAALNAGEDVVFLCEGDALFYGSFNHVLERIRGEVAVRVIAGMTSLSAAAAAAKRELASDDDVFSVVPATLGAAALAANLAAPGPKAIIKLGRNLDKVKSALARSGRLEAALLVSHAGGEGERVAPLADVARAPYFSMVLVAAATAEADSTHTPTKAAVVALNEAGRLTARTLAQALPGARAWLRGEDFEDAAATLRELFANGTPIVAVMSAGIVIRALASALSDKTAEPPVLAVSADGAHVVPLLGGHRGANRLARACAEALGGAAAVTTASDGVLGFALDDPPPGWRVQNLSAAKTATAALLAGEAVGLVVESGNADWLLNAGAPFNTTLTPAAVRVSHRTGDDGGDGEDSPLLLRPPTLALGVGCERGTAPTELKALAAKTLAEAGLSAGSVACVCSLDLKADEAAVLALADDLGVAARFFTADQLERETPRLANPSAAVFAEVGCHGVAEGAALAAVGGGGTLVAAKQKSRRATCAVALAPPGTDIAPLAVGRAAGKLFIVGTGPGRPGWRTAELAEVLAEVSDVVGYTLYLELVADLIHGKTRHTSQLSEEEARVRKALDLAAAGKSVALISSGDPGIYAMAALAFELLDRENQAPWNRVAIRVCPGISAFQAAAARIGAPMGHDFCLISLSDLLTPWPVIERRLHAAAEGGFQVALYNPVSKRRQQQIVRAREILLGHRAPETPVVLARNLGRAGERLEVITLAELSAERVDMLTLVVVGGPETRAISRGQQQWVYTPRGYGGKMDTQQER